MNGHERNGGAYTSLYQAAMTPATYGPTAYEAYCPEEYAGYEYSAMCDVCDMLRDIQGIVSDTNKVVKQIYKKLYREPDRAVPEPDKK